MKLSEGAQLILRCFKEAPEKRLTLSGIMEETGIGRRNAQNALSRLIKAQFVQRLGSGPSVRYQLIF